MSEGHWIVNLGHNMSVNMDTLITMWIAMAVLILFAVLATRKLSLVPNTLQTVAEKIMCFFGGLTESMIGKSGAKHVPLIASLFLFIVTANLMGQITCKIYHLNYCFMQNTAYDINMTAGMAILVLIYYVYQGVRAKGIRYFLRSFNPIDVVEAIVELAEMVIRPFTLALRLFANILAGELLVAAFVGIFAYFLPLPIMLFEVFVAFVQALVFTMLATAYVALATAEEEH